jgi:DNA-binding beta-propeller fold protein YncE
MMKSRQSRLRHRRAQVLVLAVLVAMAGAVISLWPARGERQALADGTARRRSGTPRLVSLQPLPAEADGAMCEWVPASAVRSFTQVLREQQAQARAKAPSAGEVAAVNARKPLRMIKDSYSAYSSVAVDLTNDEVVMTDESLFQILAYRRTENTPPAAKMSEPKRMIGGLNTWVEFQCALYIDQNTGDIYAVNNDTVDRLVIFSREQKGNVAPQRIIRTPHTTYGIAVDEPHQELFLTTHEGAAVSVFHKMAAENDAPIRLLQGDKTLLADPHGIAVDSTRDLLFVSNFGSVASHKAPEQAARGAQAGQGAGPGGAGGFGSDKPNWPVLRDGALPGTGRYLEASVTVYPRDASGDVAPIRVIRGPKTQLSWPTALSVDPKRGEIYVANDTGNSILVFNVEDSGDVAPKRIIQGPKSMVKSPTGVFYDWKHDELWVSNFGNHAATVYRATDSGDVAP